MEQLTMHIIANIHSDFPTKFGIPRQSGLVEELTAQIVFTPDYRAPEAVRGLEDFSHIWLIWQFSMGVFATRSPFRPNAIGLSCVRLLKVEPNTPEGPVLTVAGADLMDGTPILDIKPYIPYADCQMEATGGFTDTAGEFLLKVEFPPELLSMVPEDRREALIGVLRHDPRPSYQRNAERVYGMEFAGVNVRFRVEGEVLTVIEVEKE